MGAILFLYTLGSIGYIVYIFIDGTANFFSIMNKILLLAVIWFVLFVIRNIYEPSGKIKSDKYTYVDYKKQYEEALKGTDKQKALEYGRLYYNQINPNNDSSNEIKIANDLSCMKI